MEKFIFTIDNESQYFVSENRVIYWKNDFQKFFDVKKNVFSARWRRCQLHPPYSVAEKTSKSVKILPIGFSTKTRKSVITRRKWFFQNFRKKCTYGDFDENFSKFAGCLGVNLFDILNKFWSLEHKIVGWLLMTT